MSGKLIAATAVVLASMTTMSVAQGKSAHSEGRPGMDAKIESAFAKFDANADGSISKDEFMTAAEAMPHLWLGKGGMGERPKAKGWKHGDSMEGHLTIPSAGDAVDDATDTTGDAAEDVTDTTGDAIDDAADATGDAVDETTDTVGDAVDDAADATDDVVDGVDAEADVDADADVTTTVNP